MSSVTTVAAAKKPVPLPLAALVITAIWGFNFVVIKVGTDHVPPLLLAALRFFLLAFPAAFFVPRPRASWLLVASYGLFLGVGEFGLLFTAIKLGAPTGLCSLILQSQAFFTAVLAALFLRERFAPQSALGMLIAAGGLSLIGLRRGDASDWGGHFVLALAMILGAALMWAVANVLAKRIGRVNPIALLVWSSLFSPGPLLALSFAFEGGEAIALALRSLSWLSIGALAYLVLLSTLVGYGGWNHLIVEHGASKVAPYSMLVPIFGMASGVLFLHEPFHVYHLWAALLVMLGLGVHAFGDRLLRRR